MNLNRSCLRPLRNLRGDLPQLGQDVAQRHCLCRARTQREVGLAVERVEALVNRCRGGARGECLEGQAELLLRRFDRREGSGCKQRDDREPRLVGTPAGTSTGLPRTSA